MFLQPITLSLIGEHYVHEELSINWQSREWTTAETALLEYNAVFETSNSESYFNGKTFQLLHNLKVLCIYSKFILVQFIKIFTLGLSYFLYPWN